MLPLDPRQLAINKLVAHITDLFTPSTSDLATQGLLDEADLHPTQQTAYLMAQSAVMTLLAHDLGVKVTGPLTQHRGLLGDETIEHKPAELAAPAAAGESDAAPAKQRAARKTKRKAARHSRAARKVQRRQLSGLPSRRRRSTEDAAGKAAGAGAGEPPAPSQSRPKSAKGQFQCPAPNCLASYKHHARLVTHMAKVHPDLPVPPRP